MSVYLDASALVPLFAKDALSSRAEQALRAVQASVIVSDFAWAEFASAIARRTRMRLLLLEEAREVLADFDIWLSRSAKSIETQSSDIRMATAHIRRLDLTLRAPDAMHIAIAQRVGASLATFDQGMAAAAAALGLRVEPI